MAKLEARREQAGRSPRENPGKSWSASRSRRRISSGSWSAAELIRRRELRRKERSPGELAPPAGGGGAPAPYRRKRRTGGEAGEARRELESRVEEARRSSAGSGRPGRGRRRSCSAWSGRGTPGEAPGSGAGEGGALLERYLRSKRRQASASWPGRESIRRASLILSLLFLLACAGAILRPAALWGL